MWLRTQDKYINKNKNKNKTSSVGRRTKKYPTGRIKQSNKKKKSPNPPESYSVKQVAKMISNPCDGPIVRNLYGTNAGLMARYKSTSSFANVSLGGTGYLLWIPKYCGTSGNGAKANNFVFFPAGTGTVPLNTAAVPYGRNAITAGAMTSAGCIDDPTYSFMSGATAGSCRTLAACIKLSNIGRLDEISGQMGFIDNVPLSAFIGAGTNFATIDQLFTLSSKVTRLNGQTYEQRYRPLLTDTFFVSEQDDIITLGTTGTSATTFGTLNAAVEEPRVIGFVWRGVVNPSMIFEYYKTIEWTPEPGSGFVMPSPEGATVDLREKALAFLDTYYPEWTVRAADVGAAVLSHVIESLRVGMMPTDHGIRDLF
jgi:hypothetical protein